METEWVRLCREVGLRRDGDDIEVKLSQGRQHRVRVQDAGDHYELSAVVAGAAALSDAGDTPLQAWLRNRSSRLVGFRVDGRGRLIGEGWVPKAGLTAEEFAICVRRVAAESDRYEYLLTGRDRE